MYAPISKGQRIKAKEAVRTLIQPHGFKQTSRYRVKQAEIAPISEMVSSGWENVLLSREYGVRQLGKYPGQSREWGSSVGKINLAVGRMESSVGKISLSVGKIWLPVGKMNLAVWKTDCENSSAVKPC
jgi:hypothetical protein